MASRFKIGLALGSGYEQGYITTDTLQVGKGYWIKTSANGTIQIN